MEDVIAIADGRNKYTLKLDGARVGVLRYRDAGDRRVLIHTEIEPDYGGQGLATQLIEWALDDVRSQGKRAVAQCPMVLHYLETHHDFDDIIDHPAGVGD
jgi:predicted GNAT family acetyltransferase